MGYYGNISRRIRLAARRGESGARWVANELDAITMIFAEQHPTAELEFNLYPFVDVLSLGSPPVVVQNLTRGVDPGHGNAVNGGGKDVIIFSAE
jgi:hypothetical protein